MEGKISGTTGQDVADALDLALTRMRDFKPEDRSEADRRVAICITDLEKVLANWHYWVLYLPAVHYHPTAEQL